jgi:small conductance mechanosensitive channel
MQTESISHLINLYIVPWSVNITLAVIIFIVGRWLTAILVKLAGQILEKSEMDPLLVNFTSSVLRVFLMLIVIIAALDRLGVNTSSFIALIGAAGLAIGLALQGSLQNFASGVLLIMFRPFNVGHSIEAAGTAGVVEKIGIFSTQLKTADNREIIVPNGKIYNDIITNNSKRETRRIDLVFGIGYGDDMRQAKAIMERVLEADERVLKEPKAAVAVAELADSSVNFNVRPWVKASDYWAVRSDLLQHIKLAFDDAGISIPYPQMDVHLSQETSES